MKKQFALMFAIAFIALLTGCSTNKITDDVPEADNRFERMYTDAGWNDGIGGVSYYRDVVTDVVYFNMGSGHVPLLHEDGTPYLWSEIEGGE